ncbi:hypothetical protein BC827DRAFT_805904 [Russula dissimulans]|nr:hypothetical protein BC827DRAFT_805904 [Russula dissimulans]
MFHVPSDGPSNNINLMERPNPIPPSPSSSPASLSSSTISPLKAWRSASEQLPTPVFSFLDPGCRHSSVVTAISTDDSSSQRIECARMSSFDTPSSQRPTLPFIDEGDLRWTTGVPCHMLDVFRANPFTPSDLPRTISTPPPSLDNSTNPQSAEYKIEGLRSAAKRALSPDAIEQKKKSRTKRARIQSPPVVPFPATGPQEMFAYEFRLDIPYGNTSVSSPQRCEVPPLYPSSRIMDDRGHLFVPRPIVTYSSEDVSMCLPTDPKNAESSLPSRVAYPCSYTPLIFQKTRPEQRMQPSHYPLHPSMFLSTQLSLRLGEPSNPVFSAPQQGVDECRAQFEEHGCNSLPMAVPMQIMPERAQTYRLSTAPATLSMQRPLYACPLCPRDFQLPNGLALHLKWHDRVGGLNKKPIPYPTYHPHERITQRVACTESGPPDARDMRLTQLQAQDNGQRGTISGLPSTLYVALPQEAKPARADSVTSSSREPYAMGGLAYERQPHECALFHDMLHNANASLDNNTYLAPLDGLSVLQPLPFEQYNSTSDQLCARPPP